MVIIIISSAAASVVATTPADTPTTVIPDTTTTTTTTIASATDRFVRKTPRMSSPMGYDLDDTLHAAAVVYWDILQRHGVTKMMVLILILIRMMMNR